MSRTVTVGLIAEGRGDVAVLENILVGLGKELDVEFETDRLIPSEWQDATDQSPKKKGYQEKKPEEFSNWYRVIQACEEGTEIEKYFLVDVQDRIVIIHLDSAECEHTHYDVIRPEKGDDTSAYVTELRKRIINRVKGEMKNISDEVKACCYFAICVEETEAWVLALDLFYEKKDGLTDCIENPKEYLDKRINKHNKFTDKGKRPFFHDNESTKSSNRSNDFAKAKHLQKSRSRNHSLNLFLTDIEQFLA